jgi:hypothetical protein
LFNCFAFCISLYISLYAAMTAFIMCLNFRSVSSRRKVSHGKESFFSILFLECFFLLFSHCAFFKFSSCPFLALKLPLP